MKTSLSLLLMLLCVFLTPVVYAQNAWLKDGEPGNQLFQNSVGITFGTQGIGAEVGIPLSSRFNLRLNTSILPYKGDLVRSFNDVRDYEVDFKVEFMNVGALIDWQPFPNAGSFFRKFALTGGAAGFYKAGGNAKVMTTEPYRVGEIEFSPEEVGEIRAKVDWRGFAPYVGLGWHNVTISDNFNLGINLGTYYIGSPDVDMTATNWLAPNAPINEPILRNNLKDYKWLPKLEIKFNFNY